MSLMPTTATAPHGMSRRHFIRLLALSTAGTMVGCATNPVTGKSQFMLVSEGSEIELDKKNSPYQFSSDYGISQDRTLNAYINQTGRRLSKQTHRPDMPYSFQAVNATYVNAYAFPGGSIALTRGILLSLDNEAELAALLGHELGHVNARHTAEQMSKSMLTKAVVGGVAIYAGTHDPAYAGAAATLGMVGAGALLASYSRDNEREADALGLDYMVKAGYAPQGMEGLMKMLQRLSSHKPSAIELMFATHPMSDERYRNTTAAVQRRYAAQTGLPNYRDRYMDHTAPLRKIKDAIEEMQKSDAEMSAKRYPAAESHLKSALRTAPRDYTALTMMSKCLILQEKYSEAARYADLAAGVYPQEAQAHYLGGLASLNNKKFDTAFQKLDTYDQKLPGNPNILFLKGYCREKAQNRQSAGELYMQYLNVVNQGDQARHAYTRLTEWGYIK
jgi:predicted Zn-dependent protease